MISLRTFHREHLPEMNFGRSVLLLSLVLFAVGLPLSPFLVGLSQFLLLAGWLLEGQFFEKWNTIKTNRTIHIFLILPLIHIVWLLNTTDFHYALHDLKIKLPLLVFPVLLGSTRKLEIKEFKIIALLFMLAVFISSLISTAIITDLYKYPHQNIRDISIFISHIRFGLMVLMALIFNAYFLINSINTNAKQLSIILAILLVWFLFFLILLQSITSWIIASVMVFFLFAFYYKAIKSNLFKAFGWGVLFVLLLSMGSLIGKVYHDFYLRPTANFSELPKYTAQGNKYVNDTLSRTKENGYYVYILINYKELSETWTEVSKIPFQQKDLNGYPIGTTIIRYLTSKGLPKDREGVLALDAKDIEMIEKGYASCIYRKSFIPYKRVYSVIWELDRYFESGDANNKSVSQRIEYLKAAKYIIKNNFWFGVGTGDLDIEYEKAFINIKSKLHEINRLRAHNQYVTFLVSFGIFGFILSLISMLGPAIFGNNKTNVMLISYMLIVFLSMLNEDTMETQAGVSFYIFFYTLLLFSKTTNK